MPDWNHRLNLSGFYHSDIPIMEKGKLVTQAIRRIFPGKWFDCKLDQYDMELDDLVDRFDSLETNDVEAFNNIMTNLYDWADQDHRCWIVTNR